MTNIVTTYRTVTPYLLVADADAELAFLTSAFNGTELVCHRGSNNSVMHAEVQIGDSLVMLGQAGGAWKPLGGAQYLWIGDVDAAYRHALDAGAVSRCVPEDKPYGHRVAEVLDPNGITWWLAAPVK
jgi:PhnB protein